MSDSDLTPDQDESVRALLASAKHTGPTPPEVVTRLDEVLAELAAERSEVRAPVVTLASRRRRRASAALLAAAAVVVLGVGVTQVLPGVNESSDSSAGSASDSALMEEQPAGGAAEPERTSGANEPEAQLQDRQSPRGAQEKAPTFTTDSDLAVLVSTAPLRRQALALRQGAGSVSSIPTSRDCLLDREDSQDQVGVTYDGTPGVLVYRAPTAGSQQVDLFLCGEAGPFKSVELKTR